MRRDLIAPKYTLWTTKQMMRNCPAVNHCDIFLWGPLQSQALGPREIYQT